jgi:hypothetical protein
VTGHEEPVRPRRLLLERLDVVVAELDEASAVDADHVVVMGVPHHVLVVLAVLADVEALEKLPFLEQV